MELPFLLLYFLLLFSSTCIASDQYWLEDYKKRCVGADVPYYVDQHFPRCCPCSTCDNSWSKPVLECHINGDEYCTAHYKKCKFEEEFDEIFKRDDPTTTIKTFVPASTVVNTTAMNVATIPGQMPTDKSVQPIPMTSIYILAMAIVVAVVFTIFILVVVYKLRKKVCVSNAMEKLNKIVPRCFQKKNEQTPPPDPSEEILLEPQVGGGSSTKVEEVRHINEGAQPENWKPCDTMDESKEESLSINKESIGESHDKVPPPFSHHPEMPHNVNYNPLHNLNREQHVIHAATGSQVTIGNVFVYGNGQGPVSVDPPCHEESYIPSSFGSCNSSNGPPAYDPAMTNVQMRPTHLDRPAASQIVTSRAPLYRQPAAPRQHDERLHDRQMRQHRMFRQFSQTANISSTSTTGAVENDIDDYRYPPQRHPFHQTSTKATGHNLTNSPSQLQNSRLQARTSQYRRDSGYPTESTAYGHDRHGIPSTAGYDQRRQHPECHIRVANRQESTYDRNDRMNRTDYVVNQDTVHGRSESQNLYQSTSQDNCESIPHYSQEESQTSLPILRPPGDGNYSDKC